MTLAQTLSAKKVDPDKVAAMAIELATKIRSVSNPYRIILFGSAAEGRFVEGSDLDLLLVFANHEAMVAGRKAIRSLGLLHKTVAVDLVFVTSDHYDTKKDLGGVCFIAEHEGREL